MEREYSDIAECGNDETMKLGCSQSRNSPTSFSTVIHEKEDGHWPPPRADISRRACINARAYSTCLPVTTIRWLYSWVLRSKEPLHVINVIVGVPVDATT